jgi:prevent-host-death family protein
MNASKFKEKCLDVLDHLDPEGIVITKHGKPVARLIPAQSDCKGLIGSMKGKIHMHGDILSTGIEWDAQS